MKRSSIQAASQFSTEDRDSRKMSFNDLKMNEYLKRDDGGDKSCHAMHQQWAVS